MNWRKLNWWTVQNLRRSNKLLMMLLQRLPPPRSLRLKSNHKQRPSRRRRNSLSMKSRTLRSRKQRPLRRLSPIQLISRLPHNRPNRHLQQLHQLHQLLRLHQRLRLRHRQQTPRMRPSRLSNKLRLMLWRLLMLKARLSPWPKNKRLKKWLKQYWRMWLNRLRMQQTKLPVASQPKILNKRSRIRKIKRSLRRAKRKSHKSPRRRN